jgi:lysophospholipase L1-like esterase
MNYAGARRPLRVFLKRLIFSLMPLLVLLLASEGVLYILGYGTPFIRAPRFQGGWQQVMMRDPFTGRKMKPGVMIYGSGPLNSQGFNDDELNDKASLKILCLGDSTTFGYGVEKQERYSDVLEAGLNRYFEEQEGCAGHAEVYNAGVPSYTLYQGYHLYVHYLMDIAEWDYVIITFGLNENPDEELDLEFEFKKPPVHNRVVYALREFAGRFRTYNALVDAIHNVHSDDFDPSDELLANQLYASYYEKLVRLVKTQGANVIIVPILISPADQTRPRGKRLMLFNRAIKAIAEKENIAYLEVDKVFYEKGDRVKWFDRCHYDAYGHRLIADELFNFIVSAREGTAEVT